MFIRTPTAATSLSVSVFPDGAVNVSPTSPMWVWTRYQLVTSNPAAETNPSPEKLSAETALSSLLNARPGETAADTFCGDVEAVHSASNLSARTVGWGCEADLSATVPRGQRNGRMA